MPSSIFTKLSAKNVWKAVTGVSSAGSKRGRGRGTGKIPTKDLNFGQTIGFGRKRITLPGLNTNISAARPNPDIELGEDVVDFDESVEKIRNTKSVFKKARENPINRGWSGRKAHGRRAGPPAPYNDEEFVNFDSRVLMLRPLFAMDGALGRIKRMHALVVTGNKNGLAGFSTAVGIDPRATVNKAKSLAGQALIKVPIWDNHTIMHDFFSRYYFTTVFAYRKPKGYGLRCHRIIQAICEQFGIKDMYCKVEGSQRNQINITKAFFLGLMNQRNYQEMADEKELHLVEMREENFNFPVVLASPTTRVKADSEIKITGEDQDFTYFINDGRIKQVKATRPPSYVGTPSWQRHLDKLDYVKNREMTKLQLVAKYGDTRVMDVFPNFLTTAKSFTREEPEADAAQHNNK